MALLITSVIIQRIVLPIIFTLCILCRPVALAIPYLLFLLYIPFVPCATVKTIRGHTGYYFRLVIAITAFITLLQVSFQVVLLAKGSDLLKSCEFLEILFRHIGLIKLNKLTLLSICVWFLPDIVMLVSSIVAYVVLRKITIGNNSDDIEEAEAKPVIENDENEDDSFSPENYILIRRAAIICSLTTLLIAATLRPSVPSAAYFLVFLISVTCWSCLKELIRPFAIVCRLLLVLLIVHISALLAYQTPYPQEILLPNDTYVRFVGFSPLMTSNCSATDGDIRVIYLNIDLDLDAFLNPLALLLCYYTLAISSSFILNMKRQDQRSSGTFGQFDGVQQISRQVSSRMQKRTIGRKRLAKESWHGAADKVRDNNDGVDEPNERTPLMRRSMKRLKTFKQLRRGESTTTDANTMQLEEINAEGLHSTEEEIQPTIGEHITFAIGQLADLICKHSYIISNITMMVWSIVYHSWLTFIFLLFANLLWIIPNQRTNMHRASPIVVIYATFLLISQYLYCMNLTEDELPAENLAQIGFVRYKTYPCLPLLLKTLFTMTFWLTLRQMKYEASLDKHTSTLAHLAAPFQVTVSAATTDLGPKVEKKRSKIMIKAGAAFKAGLLQLWIWIVISALFFCAITGDSMTVFRITYMALFLTFMITFQLSWRVWKKIMYAFWIVVIGFSMLTLIMIYTYQFDRFDQYWNDYIGINIQLQKDIGLMKYETKSLFLRLFYPTFVVIITVVQLQMFHKKYLELLDLPLNARRDNSDSGIQPASSVNYGSLEHDSSTEDEAKIKSHKKHIHIGDLKNVNIKEVVRFGYSLYNKTKWFFEFFWLFLEIHLIKVILIIAFMLGLQEVSALHISLITLTVLAVTARTNVQTVFSGVISLVVAILTVLKMIYQIDYIPQKLYDVNCTDIVPDNSTNPNVTDVINDPDTNTANWLGFNKLEKGAPLMDVLHGYIFYIVAVTAYNFILLAQQRQRFFKGKPLTRPKVLFPRVTRADADKDLTYLVKYLFNFAFFKFGIEVTLVMLVILIGTRMDIIALIYAGWLCILFAVKRETKARIWPVFQWFIVVFIILQYVIVVNLPPFFCFKYPWDTELLQNLQEWAWLPDKNLREQVTKLTLDFLLLIFTCRQTLVFRIETQYEGNEFPGGSNKSVIDDINNLGSGEVPIQTHDFVTLTRNWLDIIKCAVFLGCFWITLAIVFLAGTNRVNIFSLGYLIGSFIFLWQGADFYLRPINTILKWWGVLIGYNIFVITAKALLQIPGCIFIQQLQGVCFLVKLLGIMCIQKFNPAGDSPTLQGCEVLKEDVGLVWDCVCFTFLILQLRIFQSYYFCHIINESKASTILASRGAELIEGLRRKQVKIQAQREEEILQKIKQKMDRIKANQQKLQPALSHPKTHSQAGNAPLARTTSMSSCAGYHTPIEDEVAGDGLSDLPSDFGLLTSRGGSFLHTQAPSPSSAIMTVSQSLDAYLEPTRLSFGSPPASELMPHGPSSEESFPVFSPLPGCSRKHSFQSNTLQPPTTTTTTTATNSHNTLQPGVHVRQHRRQSSINTVSWTDQGDSSSGRVRHISNTLDPSNKETDETEVNMRRRPSHRRQSSVGISFYRHEEQQTHRRRFSYASSSWIQNDDNDDNDDDENSARTGRSRPCSWGPVGEFFYRESLCFSESERSPISHHEYAVDESNVRLRRNSNTPSLSRHSYAVRSGDYYLFEDLDEKVELDLIHERPSAGIEDALSDKKLGDKLTIEQAKHRSRTRLSKSPRGNIRLKTRADQVLSNTFQQQASPKQRRKRTSETSHDEHEHADRPSSLPERQKLLITSQSDSKSALSEPITAGERVRIGSDTASTATPKDEYIQVDGQKPSTSKGMDRDHIDGDDDDDDDDDELSEPTSSSGSDGDEASGFAFITAFISGILVSMTLRLYKLSRNYRYVMRVLSKEKKGLKQEKDFGQGHRIGTGRVWAPLPSVLRTQGGSPRTGDLSTSQSSQDSSTLPITSEVEVHSDNGNNGERAADGTTIAHLLKPQLFPTKEQRQLSDDNLRRTSVVPEIRVLAPSLERGLDESSLRSDQTCDIVDVDLDIDDDDDSDSIKDLSEGDDDFFSQQHNILIEFLQSLWFALISNTDLLCYLLVFVNMVASASLLALPMPFMVFLWGTLSVPRPSKTFWVSLIAYTEIVVLIKCVSQFDLWFWKSSVIPPNNPMAPARIIGIEKRQNYASYDLILLLVVFFHRFVQKQMGIWKTGYSDDTAGKFSGRTPADFIKPTMAIENETTGSALVLRNNGDNVATGEIDKLVDNEQNNYFPAVTAFSSTKYCSPFSTFFRKLMNTTNRVTSDVYVYIFLCDFINFFVLLFGFTAFGSTQGDGGVTSYLEENKIPVAFLIMLLLQFIFIIVDRALYLRKNLLGKIIFQFVTVVGMHIWLFFLVPIFSERSFNTKLPPVIYYIFKCFYFILSAYQIRCGYPKRISGNCLTKGFSMLNLGAFKVYMMTPFLFELRALMDWIWTDSSMPLFEWLKMEDIFANIYELKCSRQMEKDFPAPRGQAKGSFVKYIMGGGFLIAIIALVWGPLALFALGNTVGEPNTPYEVRVSLRIGPYEPVYIMSAQSSQIHQFTEQNWTALGRQYSTDRVALTFLSNYEAVDVAAVTLGPNSTALWVISPPDLQRLKDDLLNNVTLKVRYKYSISRTTYSEKMSGTIEAEQSFDILGDSPARTGLISMLNQGNTSDRIQLPFLFPKFLKVKNLGDLKPIPQLFGDQGVISTEHFYRNLTLRLHESGTDKWWEVLEDCSDSFYNRVLGHLPYANCVSSTVMYTFSDKLFPATLSWLTAGGVIGIYSTFVFLASRFFRGLFSGGSTNIMYSELPFVDRILQLCLDIYLVRESLEFSLEEDLFAKLIFLYRSPETMIRWTRPAEEQSDEEDEIDEDETEAEKTIKLRRGAVLRPNK